VGGLVPPDPPTSCKRGLGREGGGRGWFPQTLPHTRGTEQEVVGVRRTGIRPYLTQESTERRWCMAVGSSDPYLIQERLEREGGWWTDWFLRTPRLKHRARWSGKADWFLQTTSHRRHRARGGEVWRIGSLQTPTSYKGHRARRW
jgi:hypothetical protein